MGASNTRSFDCILLRFLEDLDAIAARNEGVSDTEVREILAETVIERLVITNPQHSIPDDFAMLDENGQDSPEWNLRVAEVVCRFVNAAEGDPI